MRTSVNHEAALRPRPSHAALLRKAPFRAKAAVAKACQPMACNGISEVSQPGKKDRARRRSPRSSGERALAVFNAPTTATRRKVSPAQRSRLRRRFDRPRNDIGSFSPVELSTRHWWVITASEHRTRASPIGSAPYRPRPWVQLHTISSSSGATQEDCRSRSRRSDQGCHGYASWSRDRSWRSVTWSARSSSTWGTASRSNRSTSPAPI